MFKNEINQNEPVTIKKTKSDAALIFKNDA